jgi:hypothetical protein
MNKKYTYKQIKALRELIIEELREEFGVKHLNNEILELVENRLQTMMIAELDVNDVREVDIIFKKRSHA